MTSDQDPQNEQGARLEDDVQGRIEDIDGTLLDGLGEDDRLGSGVPEEQRTSDLDFIQMTGLTRSVPASEAPPAPMADQRDVDSGEPVSFFERGVSDVDAAMAPPSLDDVSQPEGDVVWASESASAQPPPAPEAESEPPEAAQDASGEGAPTILEPSSIIDLKGLLDDLDAEEQAALASGPKQETPAPDADKVEPDLESPDPVEETTDVPEPEPLEPAAAPDLDSVDILSSEVDDYLDVEAASADPDHASIDTAAERRTTASIPDLAEAEELVQALEAQPRGHADDDDEDEPDWGQQIPAAPVSPALERDEAIYREPRRQTGRRRSKGSNKSARRMIRWAVRLGGVALLAACIYFGAQYVATRMPPPGQTLAGVSALVAGERHVEASKVYQDFLAANPDHPQRAEMQFRAGTTLFSTPAADADQERDNATQALALFKTFLDENPAHVRAPRAKTIVGLLYYRLGEYEQAIDWLRDPLLQLKDADSELPALRTLARAYTHLGDFESAASAHLQAAALSKNFSPDVDYDRLGDLFKDRAERAEDPVERDRYRKAAIDNWGLAIRIPLIDPVNKAKIKTKRDWLQGQLAGSTGEPAEPGLTGDIPQQDASGALDSGMTAPIDPEPAPTALETITETLPAPVDGPNPQEESAFLGGAPDSPASDESATPPETPPEQSAQADNKVSDAVTAADSPNEGGVAAPTAAQIPGESNAQATQ